MKRTTDYRSAAQFIKQHAQRTARNTYTFVNGCMVSLADAQKIDNK